MEILSTWALVNNSVDWMDDAACIGSEVTFFEGEGRGRPKANYLSAAQKICQGCPVRKDCLTFALDNKLGYGVWGGKTPAQRRKILGIERF